MMIIIAGYSLWWVSNDFFYSTAVHYRRDASSSFIHLEPNRIEKGGYVRVSGLPKSLKTTMMKCHAHSLMSLAMPLPIDQSLEVRMWLRELERERENERGGWGDEPSVLPSVRGLVSRGGGNAGRFGPRTADE